MDSFFKQKFAAILARLRADGLTVVMVSHDIEFCAAYASRCALFFDGGVVTEGEPRAFFAGNSFYTTAANRMSRGLLEGVITADDVIAAVSAVERGCDGGRDRRERESCAGGDASAAPSRDAGHDAIEVAR
jgi:energy-coupling factor transport system ATP-binding protein